MSIFQSHIKYIDIWSTILSQCFNKSFHCYDSAITTLNFIIHFMIKWFNFLWCKHFTNEYSPKHSAWYSFNVSYLLFQLFNYNYHYIYWYLFIKISFFDVGAFSFFFFFATIGHFPHTIHIDKIFMMYQIYFLSEFGCHKSSAYKISKIVSHCNQFRFAGWQVNERKKEKSKNIKTTKWKSTNQNRL